MSCVIEKKSNKTVILCYDCNTPIEIYLDSSGEYYCYDCWYYYDDYCSDCNSIDCVCCELCHGPDCFCCNYCDEVTYICGHCQCCGNISFECTCTTEFFEELFLSEEELESTTHTS